MFHTVRAFIDTPAKTQYLLSLDMYRTMTGGWCNSHGIPVLSKDEYDRMTLKELQNAIHMR